MDCDSLAAISMFGEERAQTFMKGPSNVVHRVEEVVCCSQRHREHFTGREENGFSESPTNSASKRIAVCEKAETDEAGGG